MLFTRFTHQDVIGYLKKYYQKYGKHPSKKKWREYALANRLPSYSTIETMFNGWRAALIKAGIPCNNVNPSVLAHTKSREANKTCCRHGHRWKGGKSITLDGYIKIYDPNWKTTGGPKYQLEHRLVMEKIVGRRLESRELVHHKNGIRADNRPENLIILTYNLHHGEVCCPHCRKTFLIK